jgi:hypothetical protein
MNHTTRCGPHEIACFIKPGPGMKSRNKKKAGPMNIQQQKKKNWDWNQRTEQITCPSNEHVERIAKHCMNAVQELRRGPLMAATGSITDSSSEFDLRKKLGRQWAGFQDNWFQREPTDNWGGLKLTGVAEMLKLTDKWLPGRLGGWTKLFYTT